MNNELISIIIPVYNIEKYLKECLDSILNQSYKNFEVILVDDGSTDSSFDICNEYSSKDSRIKVLHTEANSGGCGIPRNIGLKQAKGDYITFIDGDDLIPKNYLEVLINKSNGKDIVYVRYFFDFEKNRTKPKNKIIPSSKFSYFYFKKGYLISAWGKLIPKEFISGIEFCSGYYEDLSTMYKVIFKAEKLIECQETFYIYRKRENSLTTTDNSEKYLSVIDNLDIIQKDLINYIKSKREMTNFDYYKLRLYLTFYKYSINTKKKEILKYRKKVANYLRKNTLKFLFKRIGFLLKSALILFLISPSLYLIVNNFRLWIKYHLLNKKEIIIIKKEK